MKIKPIIPKVHVRILSKKLIYINYKIINFSILLLVRQIFLYQKIQKKLIILFPEIFFFL